MCWAHGLVIRFYWGGLAHVYFAERGAAAAGQEGEGRGALSWLGADWGEAGGLGAREVALWVALQREFRRRGVLPAEAVRRLSLLGLEWAPQARRPSPIHGVIASISSNGRSQPGSCGAWRRLLCSGRLGLTWCRERLL